MLQTLLNYIFPSRCSSCSNLIESGYGICGNCWSKFKFISKPYCKLCCKKFEVNLGLAELCSKCIIKKPKLDMIRSLLEFSNESRELIHNFKYNDKTILGKFFADLIYKRFHEDFYDVDIIAPVPMHKFKRIFRNYNPPQILAYELSRLMNKPAIPGLLIKTRITKNQVGLNKTQRAKNLLGSFTLNKKFDIKNKVILLVDDVLTTGATSSECAKVLKQNHVAKTKLVTIAKV